MPISLKQLISEDVHMWVDTYKNTPYWDVDHLAKTLTKKVVIPIVKKMSPEQLKLVRVNKIEVVGNKNTAGVDVNLKGYPQTEIPKILGGIDHFFKTNGIKTEWSQEGDVISMKIENIDVGGYTSPAIQMSEDELQKIKELLELGKQYDSDAGYGTLSIPVKDLEQHMEAYSSDVQIGVAPEAPQNIQIIFQRMANMIKWAKSTGNEKIVAY